MISEGEKKSPAAASTCREGEKTLRWRGPCHAATVDRREKNDGRELLCSAVAVDHAAERVGVVEREREEPLPLRKSSLLHVARRRSSSTTARVRRSLLENRGRELRGRWDGRSPLSSPREEASLDLLPQTTAGAHRGVLLRR
nr:hypothetical protein Iba_scaffold41896CG0010 [Ipomoea batatas]GME04976.1 hypothetical protein Iba_scaffold2429CG0090 [Ipomoea batatas]